MASCVERATGCRRKNVRTSSDLLVDRWSIGLAGGSTIGLRELRPARSSRRSRCRDGLTVDATTAATASTWPAKIGAAQVSLAARAARRSKRPLPSPVCVARSCAAETHISSAASSGRAADGRGFDGIIVYAYRAEGAARSRANESPAPLAGAVVTHHRGRGSCAAPPRMGVHG